MWSTIWCFAVLAIADLNIGKRLVDVEVLKIQDNRHAEDPNIMIYFSTSRITGKGNAYVAINPDGQEEVLAAFCAAKPWHLWAGLVYKESQDLAFDEWWPAFCQEPTSKSESDPFYQLGQYPHRYKVLLPQAALHQAALNYDYVMRADLKTYEPPQNAVCRKNHHFFSQYEAGVSEGSQQITEEYPRRPAASYSPPPELISAFDTDVDACLFIRHPCFCDRAPAELQCRSCQMHENFGKQWLCYDERRPDNAAWCKAVTVETYQDGRPNRAIDEEEYQQLDALREQGDEDVKSRQIVWKELID